MKILCKLTEHKWLHISNFNDIKGGRALYQCERCNKLEMALPAEFYLRKKKQYVTFTKHKAYYKIR